MSNFKLIRAEIITVVTSDKKIDSVKTIIEFNFLEEQDSKIFVFDGNIKEQLLKTDFDIKELDAEAWFNPIKNGWENAMKFCNDA
tara:strand:+ start:69 stop:323 length:255 start_codon:yes stop_codon:yes gene_type:complete